MKQPMECLNETLTILPDTKDRLRRFASELNAFLCENYEEIAIAAEEADRDDTMKQVLEARQLLIDAEEACGATAPSPDEGKIEK